MKDATNLREAAERLRALAEDRTPLHPDVVVAVANLLDTEAGIRETQPTGFYEVEDADKVAAVLAEAHRDRSHVCVPECRPNAHIAFVGRAALDAERNVQ